MSELADKLRISEHRCSNGMPAWITSPKAPGKIPVVVLMHERYGPRAAYSISRNAAPSTAFWW